MLLMLCSFSLIVQVFSFVGSHAEIKLPDFRTAVFPVVGCLGICLTNPLPHGYWTDSVVVKFKTTPRANKKE
jgi:hypothetical protein